MKTETDNKTKGKIKGKKNKKNTFSLAGAINARNDRAVSKDDIDVSKDMENMAALISNFVDSLSPDDKREAMQSMTFDDLAELTEEEYIHMLVFTNSDRPDCWRPAECQICRGIAKLLKDLNHGSIPRENFTDEVIMTNEELEDLRAYAFSIFRSFDEIKENFVACTKLECKYIILKLYILFDYSSKDALETEYTPDRVMGLVFLLETILQKLKTDYGDQVSFDNFPKNPHPKFFKRTKDIDLSDYFDTSDTGVTITKENEVSDQPPKKKRGRPKKSTTTTKE